MLLGSTNVKASSKMLVKLTPGYEPELPQSLSVKQLSSQADRISDVLKKGEKLKVNFVNKFSFSK